MRLPFAKIILSLFRRYRAHCKKHISASPPPPPFAAVADHDLRQSFFQAGVLSLGKEALPCVSSGECTVPGVLLPLEGGLHQMRRSRAMHQQADRRLPFSARAYCVCVG